MLSALIVVCACVPRRVGIPEPAREYESIGEFLIETSERFNALSGSFAMKLQKPDGRSLHADVFADIGRPGETEVRFYRLGIPVGNLESLAGGDKSEYEALEGVLRDALLWWRVAGPYRARRLADSVIVHAPGKTILFKRKTFIPLSQNIKLPSGDVEIYYSDIRPLQGIRYPHALEIALSGYRLELKAEKIELMLR